VADDLLAARVDDRDLAFDDRDERVPLIADAVQLVAHIGPALVTELSESGELRVRQHRAVRRCHRMSLLSQVQEPARAALPADRQYDRRRCTSAVVLQPRP
jgi:hypothetical protein